MRSHGTHSRSGIFSADIADVSGGVIIFVKQGLPFSGFSTSSLSSLDPYSDYVEVNISLNDFSSLSFLNVYAPPIRSSTKDSRTNFFSLSILPSYVEAEAVDFSRFHRKRTASASSFRLHISGPWARHLTGRATVMWKTGDPEMATPKRVRTYRPKHSDTSLSREWRINMANKK